jgi:hypothetical protein
MPYISQSAITTAPVVKLAVSVVHSVYYIQLDNPISIGGEEKPSWNQKFGRLSIWLIIKDISAARPAAIVKLAVMIIVQVVYSIGFQ